MPQCQSVVIKYAPLDKTINISYYHCEYTYYILAPHCECIYILHIGNFVLISELFTFFLVLFCLNQLKSVLYHNHDLKKK